MVTPEELAAIEALVAEVRRLREENARLRAAAVVLSDFCLDLTPLEGTCEYTWTPGEYCGSRPLLPGTHVCGHHRGRTDAGIWHDLYAQFRSAGALLAGAEGGDQ